MNERVPKHNTLSVVPLCSSMPMETTKSRQLTALARQNPPGVLTVAFVKAFSIVAVVAPVVVLSTANFVGVCFGRAAVAVTVVVGVCFGQAAVVVAPPAEHVHAIPRVKQDGDIVLELVDAMLKSSSLLAACKGVANESHESPILRKKCRSPGDHAVAQRVVVGV